jgi:hypothetical protein
MAGLPDSLAVRVKSRFEWQQRLVGASGEASNDGAGCDSGEGGEASKVAAEGGSGATTSSVPGPDRGEFTFPIQISQQFHLIAPPPGLLCQW